MRIRRLTIFTLVPLIAILASCDLRSGIAKQEMEKWDSSPTPSIAPIPTDTPIARADIVAVDINLEGDTISIDGDNQTKTTACSKFNGLVVNGDASVITIKGACRQIMINGDRNKISADAAMKFVLNGHENIVKHSRFANGKQPSVIDNGSGNVIEKVSEGRQ